MPLKASPLKLWHGRSFWTPKWDPPHKRLVTFAICNDFVKTFEKSETLEVKSWEAQRSLWAAQQSRPFCINIEGLEGIRDFSQLDMKSDIVRRTIFFCNKELLFACWRKIGGIFKCYAVDGGKMNYFVFPAF